MRGWQLLPVQLQGALSGAVWVQPVIKLNRKHKTTSVFIVFLQGLVRVPLHEARLITHAVNRVLRLGRGNLVLNALLL